MLVAAFERLATEVVGAEVVALHERAERPVEHEHPLAEGVEERMAGAARHGRRSIPRVDHPPRVRGTVGLTAPVSPHLRASAPNTRTYRGGGNTGGQGCSRPSPARADHKSHP